MRKPQAHEAAASGGDVSEVRTERRILQFSKREDRSSVLQQDLSQMSGGLKIVLYILAVALCAGMGYMAYTMVSG